MASLEKAIQISAKAHESQGDKAKKKPADWDEIARFAESPRMGFDEIRKARLPKEKVEAILKEYLENIKFENCNVNEGYLKALGLK